MKIDCKFEKWCGEHHCRKCMFTDKVCGKCKYYIDIDSGFGHCFGVPPILVTERKFPWIKKTYKEQPKTIPWCMAACGMFEEGLHS